MDEISRARKIASLTVEQADQLKLISVGATFVFRYYGQAIRVSGPQLPTKLVSQGVAFADYLFSKGARVLGPLAPIEIVANRVVSRWPYVEGGRMQVEEIDFKQLGRDLRKLHQISDDYQGPLWRWSATELAERRLKRVFSNRELDSKQVERLAQLFREAAEEITVESHLGVGPVHMDAGFWNLLNTDDGPRWVDFDDACIAPREFDLLANQGQRLSTVQKREFTQGYGYSIVDWTQLESIRRFKHLSHLTYFLGLSHGQNYHEYKNQRLPDLLAAQD